MVTDTQHCEMHLTPFSQCFLEKKEYILKEDLLEWRTRYGLGSPTKAIFTLERLGTL